MASGQTSKKRAKRENKPPPSPRRRALSWLSALIAVLPTMVLAWWWIPPSGLDDWKSGSPPETWSTLQRNLAERQTDGAQNGDRRPPVRYTYRPLAEIAIDLQLAVLVAEDINFFGHQGIDFTAIQEAVDEWRAGERLRGASTISQQLAKNLYLSNERSWLRKLREARLARWLEHELGKHRILELYLNVIEFGDGVLGVEAAARHYYGTASNQLTAAQAAGLAATIPAPHTSNPATATRAWDNRRNIIEQRMRQAGWLRRRLERLRETATRPP